jgi:phage baseplate assembly protein W
MKKRPLPASLKKVTNKDFDLSFRAHPSTGKLLMKKDDDAVKQGLKNLLLTNRFERPFRPEFGGDVRKRLFDNFDTIFASDYENQIRTAIKNYEPRAVIDDNGSVVVTENTDSNQLYITVNFRNAVTLSDVSIDINLNKVR